MHNTTQISINKRRLLCWTPPLIASVSLPLHATSSTCDNPSMGVVSPAKCTGDPLISTAVVALTSDAALVIKTIAVSGTKSTDQITIPDLPMEINADTSLEIEWQGNGSDAVTCLPVSVIRFNVEYARTAQTKECSIEFDLISVLSEVI